MEKEVFKVSLCKELCPICGQEMDGPIVMNQVLTKEAANNNYTNMFNRTINWRRSIMDRLDKVVSMVCEYNATCGGRIECKGCKYYDRKAIKR